jgi:hypothetical protein
LATPAKQVLESLLITIGGFPDSAIEAFSLRQHRKFFTNEVNDAFCVWHTRLLYGTWSG